MAAVDLLELVDGIDPGAHRDVGGLLQNALDDHRHAVPLRDDGWRLAGRNGRALHVTVRGRLRPSNLSALLAAARAGFGLAILPRHVAHESPVRKDVVPMLPDLALPARQMHAVYRSPTPVSNRVLALVALLAEPLKSQWWAGVG